MGKPPIFIERKRNGNIVSKDLFWMHKIKQDCYEKTGYNKKRLMKISLETLFLDFP